MWAEPSEAGPSEAEPNKAEATKAEAMGAEPMEGEPTGVEPTEADPMEAISKAEGVETMGRTAHSAERICAASYHHSTYHIAHSP